MEGSAAFRRKGLIVSDSVNSVSANFAIIVVVSLDQCRFYHDKQASTSDSVMLSCVCVLN